MVLSRRDYQRKHHPEHCLCLSQKVLLRPGEREMFLTISDTYVTVAILNLMLALLKLV